MSGGRMTISYAGMKFADGKPVSPSRHQYFLATTASCMQFYCFEEPKEEGTTWTLINEFDRNKLLAAGDKLTAKIWAKRLNLKSWTYVKV